MRWRYQPVKFVANSSVVYMLCEVYLNDDGSLKSWTDPPGICPSGEDDPDQLVGDLSRMLVDSLCWETVNFQDMASGMKFKRRATAKQREALAKMVESAAHNLKQAGNSNG